MGSTLGERLSIKFGVRAAAWLLCAGLLSSLSIAQQSGQAASSDSATPAQTQTPTAAQTQAPAQSQTPAPTQQPPADKDKAADQDKSKGAQDPAGQGKVAGTSNDRLFYALPNFLTLQNGAKLPPLTAKQKFKVVALGTFDPVQYPWWGLIAAIGQ